MNTFITILWAFLMFVSGIKFGINLRSKRLMAKEIEIKNLIADAKKKNNEMITNYSKIYHQMYGVEGQWTEIDDFLMPMWMD